MRMVLSFFLALLMVLGGVAYAQDTPPTFCGDLSDTDCALLTDAAQTMMGLESAIFHLDMNLAVSGIPDAPFDSLAFQVNGDGAFSLDGEALRALQMSPEAFAENIDQLPEMIENALRAVNADVTLVFQIPPELAASSGMTLPDSVSLSLRMVNGYCKAEAHSLNKVGKWCLIGG